MGSGIEPALHHHIGGQMVPPAPRCREKGKVIVFSGTTPNIGTTAVMVGAAAQTAVQTGLSTVMICLNLKSSKLHKYLGQQESYLGLDELRADLKAGLLTPQKLRSFTEPQAYKGSRVHVLFGANQREQADLYHPKDIQHLLDAARSAYDLCFVDVSAYWDNAAIVTGLMEADCKVLVTTPDRGHFQEDYDRGLATIGPLFNIKPAEFQLVVTQMLTGTEGGVSLKEILKNTHTEFGTVIGFDRKLREWMNEGRLWEYATGVSSYQEALAPLVEVIRQRLRLEKAQPNRGGGAVRLWRWKPDILGR